MTETHLSDEVVERVEIAISDVLPQVVRSDCDCEIAARAALDAIKYCEILQALAFYANPRSYGTREVRNGVKYSDVDLDGGDKARATLNQKDTSHEA